jgi:hypothetical protein
MNSMASATGAKLLNGKLLSLALFVFAGDVIAPLAAIALEANKISHHCSPLGRKLSGYPIFAKPTMGIGPMTSSLPRKCSTD